MSRILVITIILLLMIFSALSIYVISIQNKTSYTNYKPVYQNNTIVDDKNIKKITFNKNVYKTILVNPNDSSGRTLIYERADDAWFSGTGIKQTSTRSLKYAIGSVQKVEGINNSSDLYITLVDPANNSYLIKGRIALQETVYATDFRVESVSTLQDSDPLIKSLGISYKLGKSKIIELLQKGDVVTIQLTPVNVNNSSILKEDKTGTPLITRVIIRRFIK